MNSLSHAENTLQATLLANRCEVPTTEAVYAAMATKLGWSREMISPVMDHPAWRVLYFGTKSATKLRKAVDDLAEDFPAVSELVTPLVADLIAAVAEAKVERDAAKAEKAQRKAERDARAAKRNELGVDLRAADPVATEATYVLLREVVGTAVESHYVALFTRWINEDIDREIAKGYRFNGDRETFVTREAASRAVEVVASFSAKLAGKIDRDANGATLVTAKIASNDLWSHSILTAVLSDNSTQQWHTQMILNRSVRGKLFNQWPTRRV